LRQPHSLLLRKILFQVHLWVGASLGLYIVMISVSGSILVYRRELSAALARKTTPSAASPSRNSLAISGQTGEQKESTSARAVTRITAQRAVICNRGHANMNDPILVREWSAGAFHQRVLELEAQGYIPRRETYRITPEMHPETGAITHLHVIEMLPPEPKKA
jgi:uncharacterized iron-regulated membrane protein